MGPAHRFTYPHGKVGPSMPLTADERSELGRIGVRTRLATEDTTRMTEAARERSNWGRYYDQTDPGLPHEERVRRAGQLRDAHMARMRLARKVARRHVEEARAELAALDEE
jgi:hypothetical protein